MHNQNFHFIHSLEFVFFTKRENVLKGLLHYWLILWTIAQKIWHYIVSCLCNSSFYGILLSSQDRFVHLPVLQASDLLEIQSAFPSTSSCHDNFPPAKPCLVLHLCKHTFFRFCFWLIFFILCLAEAVWRDRIMALDLEHIDTWCRTEIH